MDFKLVLNTFKWLLWRDIRVLSKDYLNNLFDVVTIPVGITVVSAYIMPYMGLPSNFGSFSLVGSVVGMCYNTPSTYAGDLVSDLEGQKNISYELTLPLPYWLVYIKIGFAYAIKAILINIFTFPIAALFIPGQIDLSQVSILKFLLIFPTINIFFAFYALAVAVFVKNIVNYGRFWIRWGWLLFLVGGWQFSWITMYKAWPQLAILSLFNPLVYTFEGPRAAILGQEGSLNFWASFFVLCLFSLVFIFFGIRSFKKKLDCV